MTVCALASHLTEWAICLGHGPSAEAKQMLMRPVCLFGEQKYCLGGNRDLGLRCQVWGELEAKDKLRFWPLVVIQKLPTPSF